MNKPDWKDAPEWANWLAMDENGKWFWYEDEPELIYTNSTYWEPVSGNVRLAANQEIDWLETLEKRP